MVVEIDNKSLYSVVLFWEKRRKSNMAGVVTYGLEPPAATHHFLLMVLAIDNKSLYSVVLFGQER